MAKLKDTAITGNLTVSGTIRGSLNGADMNVGTVSNDRLMKSSTTAQGIVQLNDAVNSTSTTQAATANAVKKANDNANTKEPSFSKNTAFNKNFETSASVYKAPGTAAVGTSNNVARADHVHPVQTTVSGNAGTATRWATARTITLGGDLTGSVSIDGSANVTLSGQVGDNSHNHTSLTGSGGATILQDHNNGNVTLSASKNSSGSAGDLYLGYTGGSWFTNRVLLRRTMQWMDGAHTIVDSSGKIPWSTLVGVPTTFTPSSHTHDDRYYTEGEVNTKLDGKANTSGDYANIKSGKSIIHDTRGANRAPNYYDRRSARFDFVESAQVGYGSGWNTLLTVSPWSGYDNTHRQVQMAFNGGNLGMRYATSDTAWSGWHSLYHTGNKPTWSDVGAIRAGNWATNGGQDLLVHGKRALVGETNGTLHLGYGNDFTNIKCGNGYTVYHTGNLNPYQMDGTNSGWFRTTGNNGIYFGTHGGGFHMTDGTWIRTYNDKNLYCSRAIYASGELKTDSQVALPGGAFLNKDTLRLAKGYNGQYSQIMFNGQSNDDGRIIHYENNNSSQLWLMPSDDHNSGSDEVIIGSISGKNAVVDFQGGTWSRAVSMNTAGNITAIGNIDAANARSGQATRVTNFNARHASGWYGFANNASARPTDWGIALCIQLGTNSDFCWIAVGTNNLMWTRWYVNGGWTGWSGH